MVPRVTVCGGRDRNGLVSQKEYVLLLNTVASNAFEGYPFVALPLQLRTNYETLATSTGQIEMGTTSAPQSTQRSIPGNIFLRGRGRKRQSSSSSRQEQQQSSQDHICASTESALTQAAAQEQLLPLRLTIQSSFIAYNLMGMKTPQEFWENATDLGPAFEVFLEEYVMNAMESILLPSKRRLELRNLGDFANDTFWILSDTADVGKKVQETPCPPDTPQNASCLISTAEYEVFVLTDDPNDKARARTIYDAAREAMDEGIENGSLQSALDIFNPQSPWTLQASGTYEDDTTPPPAPSLLATSLPTNASTVAPEEAQVTYRDDDDVQGDVTTVVYNATPGENQCGGELGKQALDSINTGCDSFIGRNFWHIVVIVGIVVFLIILFFPICIWGRYPCLGQRAPKSNAKLFRGPPSQEMDIATRKSESESDTATPEGSRSRSREQIPELTKRRRMFRSKSWSNERTIPAGSQHGRDPGRSQQERLDELCGNRARSNSRETPGAGDRPRPTRRPPRRSRSDIGEYQYSTMGPPQPHRGDPLVSRSDHGDQRFATKPPLPRGGTPRRSQSDSGEQQRFATNPTQPRRLFPIWNKSDSGDREPPTPRPRRRVPLRSKSADSGNRQGSSSDPPLQHPPQPRRRVPLRSKSYSGERQHVSDEPPRPRRRVPLRSKSAESGDWQQAANALPSQKNQDQPRRRVPIRTRSDLGDRKNSKATEPPRPRPTRRTPRRSQSFG
jgi:hypothetical protein